MTLTRVMPNKNPQSSCALVVASFSKGRPGARQHIAPRGTILRTFPSSGRNLLTLVQLETAKTSSNHICKSRALSWRERSFVVPICLSEKLGGE